MFLHRLFGYRGVILFPWSARVYDRDKFREKKDSPPSAASPNPSTPPQSPDNPMGYHPPSQAPPGNLDCDALGQWRDLEDLLFLFMAVFPAGAEHALAAIGAWDGVSLVPRWLRSPACSATVHPPG